MRFVPRLGVLVVIAGCQFEPPAVSPGPGGPVDARMSDGREPGVPDDGMAGDGAVAVPDAGAPPDAPASGVPGCKSTTRRWYADFEDDPTEVDDDGDPSTSWVVRGSTDPLPAGSLANGAWKAPRDVALDTTPNDDFAGVTVVEVRMRDPSMDVIMDRGAVFWINADWDGDSSFAPIFVAVRRGGAGMQTVTLYGKSSPAQDDVLLAVAGSRDGWVTIGLRIDADDDEVVMWIDGLQTAPVRYPSFEPEPGNLDERFATVLGYDSEAEFDYVRVEVCAEEDDD